MIGTAASRCACSADEPVRDRLVRETPERQSTSPALMSTLWFRVRGTVENLWWMLTSTAVTGESSSLAPPTGFEPVLPA